MYWKVYRVFRTKFEIFLNFFLRVIDEVNYYTLEDHRNDLPGPSYTVTSEDKLVEVEEHFENNPTDSI